MNRIITHFKNKPSGTLNVFCTAGYPGLKDIIPIMEGLQEAGADMIEIGMPFSDPTADGSTIQYSNTIALSNGMNLDELFDQLSEMRKTISIPVLLMGYLNPAIQFGFLKFLDKCAQVGVDGLILPDLPMREYRDLYKHEFEERGLSNIFLVTPQTSPDRIKLIDEVSNGFIYVVSTFATTGGASGFGEQQQVYFKQVADMELVNPTLIGFGIHDPATFRVACGYANGAIIGSAFINALKGSNDVRSTASEFVKSIRE
ncbi:MAG: tryptophan synthase subunit alpha [Bacteroidetes bacterium]|nr:tryptophan synthase subunit alpha [Bacteroidota bacterium]